METFDLEDIKELDEHLKRLSSHERLNKKSEVHVEITGTWGEIRDLLSQPYFKNIWFDPKRGGPQHGNRR